MPYIEYVGRKPKFTYLESLNSAMSTFWSKGWNASSLEDLMESMGLQKGTFYRSFGTKKDVMVEALKHYNATIVKARQQQILESERPVQAIKEFYKALVSRNVADKLGRTCFNTNTTVEVGAKDKRISPVLKKATESWEKTFSEALRRAQKNGELDPQMSVQELSRFLVVLTQGINVVSKIEKDEKFFQDVLKVALATLKT